MLQDPDFDTALAHYLAAGMPARHALSIEEYISKCRKAWNECETDARCPHKLLMDKLYTETLAMMPSGQDYVDPRARSTIDTVEPPHELIYCLAVGHVPLLSLLHGEDVPSIGSSSREGASPDRMYENTLDLYIVGLFDVLGFEAMYRSLGPHRLREKYDRLIAAASSKTSVSAVGMTSVSGGGMSPMLFHLGLGFGYFSDTLLFWAPFGAHFFSPFLSRCADVMIEALNVDMALRGAVAVGEAIIDKKAGIFLGTPLIDSTRLEHSQDWIGVALARSFGDRSILEKIDSSLLLPYTPPCKPGTPALHAGFVLDWPRRAREQGIDVAGILQRLNRSERFSKYYDNTLEFVRVSGARRRWNRDTRVPIVLGALRRAIIRSRMSCEPLEQEMIAILDSVKSTGSEGEGSAAYLRSLAVGEDPRIELSAIPEGPRRFSIHLQEVFDEKVVDLEDLALGALEARSGVKDLARHHRNALVWLESRSPMARACAELVRAILDGTSIPEEPEDNPKDIHDLWSEIRRALGDELPRFDMERLLADVLYANANLTPLCDASKRRLELLDGMPGEWPLLASYLRRVAVGEDSVPPPEAHALPAQSTARVVQQIEAWQVASRVSLVKACDEALIRSPTPYDLGELLRVIVRRRDSEELERKGEDLLTPLESAGSPHDAVARFVRRLLHNGEEAEIPGGTPADVKEFLTVARSIRAGTPITLPVQHLIETTLRARRSRESLGPYDISLCAFLSQNDEAKRFIDFLGLLAGGEKSTDALESLSPRLREHVTPIMEFLAQESEQPSLENLGKLALRIRRGTGEPIDVMRQMVEEARRRGAPYEGIANFVFAIAAGGEVPDVPSDTPDHIRGSLYKLRLLALLGTDELDLTAILSSALALRWHNRQVTKGAQESLEALKLAGGPYGLVHEFVMGLMVAGAFPQLPSGVPLSTLAILAQARREALELEGTVVAVSRGPASSQHESS